MTVQLESLKLELKRLQARVNNLQKENSTLRAALGRTSTDFYGKLLNYIKALHCSQNLRCEYSLIPLLDESNCVNIFAAAYEAGADGLREQCLSFVSTVWVRKLVNSLNASGLCPLYLALSRNHTDLAEQLIRLGGDVNQLIGPLQDQQEPLGHYALRHNHPEAVQFLLERDYEVNSHSEPLGSTLLHVLASLSVEETPTQLELANSLLSHMTDLTQPDANGQTALHLAILHNNVSLFRLLINQSGRLDLNVNNGLGVPPLWLALLADFESEKLAVRQTYGFPVESSPSTQPSPDVSFAVKLIEAGADVNSRLHVLSNDQVSISRTTITPGHREGDTLLIACARCGLLSAAKFLLRQSDCIADSMSSTCTGETAFHVCVEQGLEELACLLATTYEADPNRMRLRSISIPAEENNETVKLPIHLLVSHNPTTSVDIQQRLFEICALPLVDARDASSNTPLILAYREGNIPLCITLVHSGASLGLSNSDGHSIFNLSRIRTRSANPDRILSQILDSLMQEPRWEDGASCMECNVKFGLTNRKHHCRHCGRLLCATCSNFELPIVKFGIAKPVRVCETCFQFLNNPLGL